MYKKILLSLVAIVTLTLNSFGQAPEGFKYQAVVRDAGNTILNNQAVGMRLTIQQGSIGGTAVYTETFAVTTNAYGLVNLEIGSGTTTDDFTIIDWANGPYFIETAVDVNGGTSYVVMGTSQLMSVPYALHAKTAENVTNDQVNDADADPTNELQNWSNLPGIPANIDIDATDDFSGDYNDLTNQPTIPTVPSNVSAFTNDAGYVTTSNDADSDPTNELQALSLINDTLYLVNGGQIYMGGYNADLVDDADADPTNELQILTISNDTIYLSSGGFVKIPANNWSLTGNSGTVNGINFIGTIDDNPLNFRVNNQSVGRIDSNSDVFFGYQAGSNNTAIENTAVGFQSLQFTDNPLSLANTAIGYKTLQFNNGLGRNTAVGAYALLNNTFGEWNTSIGAASMLNNTTGSNNTSIGGNALSSNQSGSGNTAIGPNSLMTNISGNRGVAVGVGAQQNANNTSSPYDNYNVAVGYEALRGSTSASANTGNHNTAIGYQTLFSNTNGYWNTAIGDQALTSNTTGYNNAALGRYSLRAKTTGFNNTGAGASSLEANTIGNNNTALGAGSMLVNINGNNNTAVGTSTLYNNNAGNNNTAMGFEAGFVNNGSGNVFIGYRAGYTETGSNKLYIANSSTNPPLIYGDFASGNIGFGTISPTEKLVVQGSSVDGRLATFYSTTNDNSYITLGRVLVDLGGYIKYITSSNYIALGVHGHTEDLVVNGSGNVGIGTTSPTAKLEVNGQVKITGGSPAAGKILTSDVAGLATWEAKESKAYGMVYRSSAFDIPVISTWTDLPLDGGESNLVNVTHSTSVNPERVTVSVSGTYLIQYIVHYRRQSFPHHGVARIIKNGVDEIVGSYTVASPISGDANEEDPLTTQVITSLSANDYINIQVATNINLVNEVDSYYGPDLPAPDTNLSVSITLVKIGD